MSPDLPDATDEFIDDAVRFADPMVLRGLLYQLTGDDAVADTKVEPVLLGFLETQAVTAPTDLQLLRARAADLLKSRRDAGAEPLTIGPADRLQRSLSLAAGQPIADSELELWIEQLALDPWARGLRWRREPEAAELEQFDVVVIGAGMGGLNAAVQLKRAGIPFTVLEKNGGVGGTWYENRYPGARVDSPSRCYTHIFGVGFEYPNPFSEQRENERYFNWVADQFAVRDHIVFDTEVTSARWDDTENSWHLDTLGPDGPGNRRARIVISCVGTLSRPAVPRFDGADEFRGAAFHTARWPEDIDLTGKSVAVVGTGCTGYQLIPVVAEQATHTYVVQRTPNWCFEVPGYLEPYAPQVLWLDRHLPFHSHFTRFRNCWLYGPENFRSLTEVAPDFHDPHARSPLNKRIRDQRMAFLTAKLGHRPDLLRHMIPEAPPLAARPVLVDADNSIYDALLRDDVTLVPEGVDHLTAEGFETASGREYAVDVIVYATGFKASDYLQPMTVRGRAGRRLEDLWAKDGARAYLGTMLPGFPNFFMLYGPNTNPNGGLMVVDTEEMITRFALECIQGLLEEGRQVVEVDEDAYQRYNTELDAREATKIYKDPRAHNYFQNEFGRSATNCPIDVRRLWHWLRDPTGNAQVGAPASDDGADVRPLFGADLTTR
jgi:4-hydroxyacetophenone monooxygenase